MGLSERQLVADMKLGFDALGPLARAVVRNSPIEITVGEMLVQWRSMNYQIIGRDEGYSLTDADVDKSVAEFVLAAIKRKFGKRLDEFVVDRRTALRDNARHQRR